nr:MAG TPA: hypothetical protein [Inoviridae sp.]
MGFRILEGVHKTSRIQKPFAGRCKEYGTL